MVSGYASPIVGFFQHRSVLPGLRMAVMTDGVEAVFFGTFPTVPLSPFSVSFFCAQTAPCYPEPPISVLPWQGLTACHLRWTFPLASSHQNPPVPH